METPEEKYLNLHKSDKYTYKKQDVPLKITKTVIY